MNPSGMQRVNEVAQEEEEEDYEMKFPHQYHNKSP